MKAADQALGPIPIDHGYRTSRRGSELVRRGDFDALRVELVDGFPESAGEARQIVVEL